MKIFRHEATVTGKSRFPIKLLAMEGAFPTDLDDSESLRCNLTDPERSGALRVSYSISLSKYSPHKSHKGGFCIDLWREEGWSLVPEGVVEEDIKVNKRRVS